MNCPLCSAPLDGADVCPVCGTPVTPEETPKYAPASLPGIYYDNLEPEIPEPPKRARQAASPEERKGMLIGAALLAVFLLLVCLMPRFYYPTATALRGDDGISMDNRTFGIYYQAALSSYISANTDSQGGSSVPFSTEKPLNKQYYDLDSGYTWQDYFMDQALSTAALTKTLVQEAGKAGFTMDAETSSRLDSALAALAEPYGGDLDAYALERYGKDVSGEILRAYMEDSYLAQAWSEKLYQSYDFSDEELLAFYNANPDLFSDLEISEIPNVNVRHILFVPEGDTEADLKTAREAAEDALAQCRSGGAEAQREIFLRLVPEYSMDMGSHDNGGLLENVNPGAIPGSFDQWCFDPAGHEPGDLAVVQSAYGWHVIYFEGYTDTYYWKETVRAEMRSQALGAAMRELAGEADCQLTHFARIKD